MDDYGKRLFFGEAPPHFPPQRLATDTNLTIAKGIGVSLVKNGISLPEGSHAHDSYEFLLPYVMPQTRLDKLEFRPEPNTIYAFNPNQAHGPSRPVSNCYFSAVMIDRSLIRKVSRSISGTSDVYFKNKADAFFTGFNELLSLFACEARNRQQGYELILESLAIQIVVNLLRTVENNVSFPVREKNYYEKTNIKKAIDFLMESYHDTLSLNALAQVANLSPYHFIRVFKAETGKTPFEFLLDIKIDRASQLLGSGQHSITQVCYMTGFNSLSHFTTAFKRKTGLTPSEYRKQVCKQS